MAFDNFLKYFDNSIKSLNNNRTLLIFILILITICYTFYSDDIVEKYISIFDNDLFKLTIFFIISYIAGSCPAIAIILGIIMLVNLQIITHVKLKNELDEDIKKIDEVELKKEKFGQIEPVDMSYFSNGYLTNPFEKINELAPPANFNLKLINPNDLSKQMILDGKKLLNDSFDLENEIKSRYDSREEQIVFDTKRIGEELVESGKNRLYGIEYGNYDKENKILYPNKLSKYFDEPIIKSSWNELIITYNELKTKKMDIKDFDLKLEKIYYLELELLENIYRFKKKFYCKDKQEIINKLINDIKNLLDKEKKYIKCIDEKLKKLHMIMI